MEAILIVGIFLTALLAYANGSNDVSKAIATLVGSGVTNYRRAILWGSLWTTVGSLLAAFFALSMVKTFTTGWLAGDVRLNTFFPLAVLSGALIWVLIASYTGLPVSTTHVSTSAIMAVGLRKGVGFISWPTVRHMALAWVVTLPVAGLFAALAYYGLRALFK